MLAGLGKLSIETRNVQTFISILSIEKLPALSVRAPFRDKAAFHEPGPTTTLTVPHLANGLHQPNHWHIVPWHNVPSLNIPKKSCAHQGCPNLTDTRYCSLHQSDAPVRKTASERGYDNKWTVTAKSYLSRHPFCADLFGLHPERKVAATVVMHIVAHKGDMKKFWDHNNWAPGCAQCNGYQCVKYEGGFGRKSA